MASNPIIVGEQPIFTRRKLRVAAIGAGFANLNLAYKHKYVGDNEYMDLVIYEKNPEIGGTWFENKYPGVACDVPAHIVCFNVKHAEQLTDWSLSTAFHGRQIPIGRRFMSVELRSLSI